MRKAAQPAPAQTAADAENATRNMPYRSRNKHPFILIGMVVWTAIYYLCFERAGYLYPTSVFLFGLLSYFNRNRHKTNLAIALGVTVVFDLLFSQLLGVPMPTGLLPILRSSHHGQSARHSARTRGCRDADASALYACRRFHRHDDQPSAGHRPVGRYRVADSGHLRHGSDHRADDAHRHLLRLHVRRRGHGDSVEHARRCRRGDDGARRLSIGEKGQSGRDAGDRRGQLVHRRHDGCDRAVLRRRAARCRRTAFRTRPNISR